MLVKTIDVYFTTSKKSFFYIVEMDRLPNGLIRLVDWENKEFLLNWNNVNFIEDMGLYEIEKGVRV